MIQAGQVVVMVGYSDQVPGVEHVFSSGDLLFVLNAFADGEIRCCKMTLDGRIDPRQADQLWSEEVLQVTDAAIRVPASRARWSAVRTGKPPAARASHAACATLSDVERILRKPKSKDFKDLRDRAAHLYVSGGYANHLRPFFSGALCIISSSPDGRLLADPQTGAIQVAEAFVQRLTLDYHPMVQAVRKLQGEGWRIQQSLGPNKRRPYTKVFLHRGEDRRTIQLDGSMLDHWPR